MKPNFRKWIDDLLEDFEFTIEHNNSDTQSDVRVEETSSVGGNIGKKG